MFLSDGDPNDTPAEIMESLKLLVEDVPTLITMVYGLDIDNQILRDVSTHEFTKYGVSNPAIHTVVRNNLVLVLVPLFLFVLLFLDFAGKQPGTWSRNIGVFEQPI